MKKLYSTKELTVYSIFLLTASVLFAFVTEWGTTGPEWWESVYTKISMSLILCIGAGMIIGEIMYQKYGKKSL